jgi:hypothetical protein
MSLSVTAANGLLSQWDTAYASFASLHTAYSISGANEVAGGSYARVAVTFAAPASQSMALSGGPYTINVPASTTVEFVGFWSASTSGTFGGMFPLGNASAFAFAAPSSTSTLLAPGSAYTSNQQVCVFPTGGSSLPSGLTAGTIYFVKSPSGDSFQLSATSGPGSAITLSSDGSGIVQAITPEAFGSAGTFSLSGTTVNQV